MTKRIRKNAGRVATFVIALFLLLLPQTEQVEAYTTSNDAVFYLSDEGRTTTYKYTISGFELKENNDAYGEKWKLRAEDLTWKVELVKSSGTPSFEAPQITGINLYPTSVQAHKVVWELPYGNRTELHNEFLGKPDLDVGTVYYGVSISFDRFRLVREGYHVEDNGVKAYVYGTNDNAYGYNHLYDRNGNYVYTPDKNNSSRHEIATEGNFKKLLFPVKVKAYIHNDKVIEPKDLGYILPESSFDPKAGTMTLNCNLMYFGGLVWTMHESPEKVAMQSDIPEYVFSSVPNKNVVKIDANWGTLYDYMQTNRWTNTSYFHTEYGATYWNNIGGTQPKRDGFTFEGWYTDRDGGTKVYNADGTCVNGTGYWKDNLWSYTKEEDVILYAHWKQSTHKLTVNPNGGMWNGSGDQQEFTMNAGSTKTIDNPVRAGFTFRGWIVDGAESSINGTTFKMGNADTVLTAEWEKNSYNVRLNAGTGVKSVTGAGSYLYNAGVSVSAALQEGYHWKGWTGSYEGNSNPYRFTMPANDVEMTAEGEANTYTIVFNPNGGTGHMDGISAQYDTDVILPDGASGYQKYTLDGVNVTEEVTAGTISLSVPEEPEEGTEEPELPEEVEISVGTEGPEPLEDDPEAFRLEPEGAEGTDEPETISDEPETVSDEPETRTPKVYASVFMGWSLEDGKDSFIPQWKVGDAVRNLTAEDDGVVTLYAVWDDCPWIQADDLYYTLEQAQSGFITEQEILRHATASDREDGSPIEAGFHENGTSFSIPDYQTEDFTRFEHDGSVTENLTVVDSAGSVYRKRITVHIVDMTSEVVKPEGTTRFINEKFFNESFENGGLEDNSVWKTNPEYRATLQRAFDNLRNDTPEESYYFTHEDVLEMQKFYDENGIGNSKNPNALSEFYDKFMAPNKIK